MEISYIVELECNDKAAYKNFMAVLTDKGIFEHFTTHDAKKFKSAIESIHAARKEADKIRTSNMFFGDRKIFVTKVITTIDKEQYVERIYLEAIEQGE